MFTTRFQINDEKLLPKRLVFEGETPEQLANMKTELGTMDVPKLRDELKEAKTNNVRKKEAVSALISKIDSAPNLSPEDKANIIKEMTDALTVVEKANVATAQELLQLRSRLANRNATTFENIVALAQPTLTSITEAFKNPGDLLKGGFAKIMGLVKTIYDFYKAGKKKFTDMIEGKEPEEAPTQNQTQTPPEQAAPVRAPEIPLPSQQLDDTSKTINDSVINANEAADAKALISFTLTVSPGVTQNLQVSIDGKETMSPDGTNKVNNSNLKLPKFLREHTDSIANLSRRMNLSRPQDMTALVRGLVSHQQKENGAASPIDIIRLMDRKWDSYMEKNPSLAGDPNTIFNILKQPSANEINPLVRDFKALDAADVPPKRQLATDIIKIKDVIKNNITNQTQKDQAEQIFQALILEMDQQGSLRNTFNTVIGRLAPYLSQIDLYFGNLTQEKKSLLPGYLTQVLTNLNTRMNGGSEPLPEPPAPLAPAPATTNNSTTRTPATPTTGGASPPSGPTR